ncbi:Uncharacterized protein TCM_023307 [Theobroma cacao]|uniref:Uncharacterized protein n=1 Tax=Theobroma cacao TaxID=3641 RepID=A0A061EV98_THECC|nr:Uncharacterized protein TCM_023307 [Theobroma cacao]
MYQGVYWLVCHQFFSNQANICYQKTYLLVTNSFSRITQAKNKNPYLSLPESPKPSFSSFLYFSFSFLSFLSPLFLSFFPFSFISFFSPFFQLISFIFFPRVWFSLQNKAFFFQMHGGKVKWCGSMKMALGGWKMKKKISFGWR